jgi:hypothetical protein
MYNPDQKQYIIKNSFGVSYHVYFEQGRGLCIRMLSDSRIWSRGYVLDKSAINDFAVALDKNDVFHFVFQTNKGSIMYGHGMHGQIEVHPILASKEATSYPKHVSLLLSGDTVLFFYIVKHQNQHILSMQSIQNGILSKPLAIDYVHDPSYIPFLDVSGKCHLVYINSNHNKMQINHRIIKDDFSIFNAPSIIHSCEGNISSLSYVLTNANKIYIAFEVSKNGSYEVIFMNLLQAKQINTLYTSKSPAGHIGLLYIGGVIYFYRTDRESIYFIYSNNEGLTWSNEALYATISNAICFSYTSNYSQEEKIYSQQIPGNFTRGYNLAFLNDETVNTIQETKKSSKEENSDYSNLKSKVLKLQNLTDIMEKELTKLWATQKIFERRLEHLNDLYEQLHDVINYEHINAQENNQFDNHANNQTNGWIDDPIDNQTNIQIKNQIEELDEKTPIEHINDILETCQTDDTYE